MLKVVYHLKRKIDAVKNHIGKYAGETRSRIRRAAPKKR